MFMVLSGSDSSFLAKEFKIPTQKRTPLKTIGCKNNHRKASKHSKPAQLRYRKRTRSRIIKVFDDGAFGMWLCVIACVVIIEWMFVCVYFQNTQLRSQTKCVMRNLGHLHCYKPAKCATQNLVHLHHYKSEIEVLNISLVCGISTGGHVDCT